MKLELLSLCNQIEDEPWYDVSKWDIWYRMEKWFGRLDIDHYVDDINAYYRKTIDINGANVDAINKIFDEVAATDAQYGQAMKEKNEQILILSQKIASLKVE